MEKRQVKSKERVAAHGEVFTAEREVKAMCDLVAAQCDNVDATFLEPACGNGNFLSEILGRKLQRVSKDAGSDRLTWEWLSVRAVTSLYGVDIMQTTARNAGIAYMSSGTERIKQPAKETAAKKRVNPFSISFQKISSAEMLSL